MKKWFARLICKLFGHDWPALTFDSYSLCFCRRCGEEVAGRTFADLPPLPPDHDGFDHWEGMA